MLDIMKTWLVAFATFMLACPVSADQLASAGRIEFSPKKGSCSAVLIRPDIIATAAHCAGERAARGGVVFRPGSGSGARAYSVKRFLNHPLYEGTTSRIDWRLRFDIAIGELAEPVPSDHATPIVFGDDAMVGERLFLISWRGGDRPRQRICQVIDGIKGLVTLGCAVRGGESGAPVLRKTETGLELVAIISSKGRQLDQPVAHASDVRLRLPPLIDELNSP